MFAVGAAREQHDQRERQEVQQLEEMDPDLAEAEERAGREVEEIDARRLHVPEVAVENRAALDFLRAGREHRLIPGEGLRQVHEARECHGDQDENESPRES